MKRFIHILCLFLTMSVLAVVPAHAKEAPKPYKQPDWSKMKVLDSGKIAAVLRGDLVMLNDDRRYRLENILVPTYEDPMAAVLLQQKFLGKRVTVYAYRQQADGYGNVPVAKDREGLPYAQIVERHGGLWMQAYLVSHGMAWAYYSKYGNSVLEPLKIAETHARHEKLGLWRGSANAIKTPDEVSGYTGSYQIVDGKIISVRPARGQGVFFNFSKDWKTCFSVLLPGNFTDWYPDKKDAGYTQYQDPYAWKGRTVRVRGWVRAENGKPVIHITSKHQIDVLAQSGQ